MAGSIIKQETTTHYEPFDKGCNIIQHNTKFWQGFVARCQSAGKTEDRGTHWNAAKSRLWKAHRLKGPGSSTCKSQGKERDGGGRATG